MTSSSSAPLLLADPIPRAGAYSKVQAASAHQSLVRSSPIRTEEQQVLYEKRQAEAKKLFEEQQEEGKKQEELATQRREQEKQTRRQQEELDEQRREQERQARRQQEQQAAERRKQERQAREREQEEQAQRAHEEVKRRTPLHKFNVTKPGDKKRFKKIALTEVVFVLLDPAVYTEYRRLREEAASLMHKYGPFSASAMAAHEKFVAYNEDELMWKLPSMGLEWDEEGARFVRVD